MFCFNNFCNSCTDTVISLYWGRFYSTLGALKTHRYIGNIVISKIIKSGFCPIHFTVTFAGT